MMKMARWSIVWILGSLSIAGCGSDAAGGVSGTDDGIGGSSGYRSGGASGARDAGRIREAAASEAGDGGFTTPALAICSDGQVAAIASAANRAEIAEARAIINATDNAAVRSFASTMITDHTRLEAATTAILARQGITPVESGLSREITHSSQLTVQELGTLTGRQRDAAYIDHEMLAHAQILATLDSILLPSVKNAELSTALQQARQVVASHLDLAACVQGEVEGSCGGTSGGASAEGGAEAVDAGDSGATGAGGAAGTVGGY